MFGKRTQHSDSQMGGKNLDQEKSAFSPTGTWWQRWSWRRKLLLIGAVLIVIALAIGLGVGLASAKNSDDEAPPPSSPPNGSLPQGLWKPAAGTSWNLQLLKAVDESTAAADDTAEVWDMDLFDNDEETIQSLQSANKKVVCYFSAGTFEDWRPDKDKFEDSDKGDNLADWAGERWLDTNSANVRKIMQTRMDMAVQKKCDGVDPDNVDAYDNENGLQLSQSDATDFTTFLAQEAHSRNLSIALKNAGAIVSTVVDLFDYSVQEQCLQFDNCDQFMPFIEANKPVFHVEYPKGDQTNNDKSVATETQKKICDNSAAAGFSTIIKNMQLDQWIEPCSPSTGSSSRR